jgi:hypothetical protein
MATANKDDYRSDSEILDIVLEAEQEFFEAVEDVAAGVSNIVIAKGPPGVGKSFGVAAICKKMGVVSTDLLSSMFEEDVNKEGSKYPYNCISLKEESGAVRRGSDYSTWAFVADLYGNRNGGVINMEDNDKALKDDVFVGLMMQATEQLPTRFVSYPKAQSTHELQFRGVEPVFDFQGGIIITTNIDMLGAVQESNVKKEKDKSHVESTYLARWAALMSRGNYVDMQMDSPRSVRVYCENKITTTGMLTKSAFLDHKFGRSLTLDEQNDALSWLRKNQANLQLNLDLRTYNKLAGIMIRRGANWEKSAKVSLLNRGV